MNNITGNCILPIIYVWIMIFFFQHDIKLNEKKNSLEGN
jgi:hypothetical protein